MKNNGFTMMEVMVAMAIVGISLGVFISILGNSLKMRWKLEDHAKNVTVARITAEKMRLGLIEDVSFGGEEMEGETEDGTYWKAIPITITARENNEYSDELDTSELEEKGLELDNDTSQNRISFYNIVVGGVELSSSVKGGSR